MLASKHGVNYMQVARVWAKVGIQHIAPAALPGRPSGSSKFLVEHDNDVRLRFTPTTQGG